MVELTLFSPVLKCLCGGTNLVFFRLSSACVVELTLFSPVVKCLCDWTHLVFSGCQVSVWWNSPCFLQLSSSYVVGLTLFSPLVRCLCGGSNRKAMNRNWSNQKSNPALKTKAPSACVVGLTLFSQVIKYLCGWTHLVFSGCQVSF